MLPYILKNTDVGRSITNNEGNDNDEELDKSINEFSKNKIAKLSKIKKN